HEAARDGRREELLRVRRSPFAAERLGAGVRAESAARRRDLAAPRVRVPRRGHRELERFAHRVSFVESARRRGSVISSIAYAGPSRELPESLTPPYGIRSARQVGTSFTTIPPTSSVSNARATNARSFVK